MFPAGESVIPGEPSTSSVKSNKQTIAANVEGYSNAMKEEAIAKNNLGLFPETPNAVSEPLETSSAGIATELVLGVPGGGVSDSGGTEHQLGEKQ